jgi:biuret amidohydrolase
VSIDVTELVRPDRTAVVLMEMQRGVIGDATFLPQLADAARETGIVDSAARLCRAGRARGVPVVHATAQDLPGHFGANSNARLFAGARKHGAANLPGTRAVEPLPELLDEGDLVMPRHHGLSPLTDAQLDTVLRNAGVRTVVVAGVSLNIGIQNLVFDAVNRSYDVVLATDAVAGVPVEYGRAVVDNSLSLLATLTTSEELASTWSS